jgi:hypothetical protein
MFVFVVRLGVRERRVNMAKVKGKRPNPPMPPARTIRIIIEKEREVQNS